MFIMSQVKIGVPEGNQTHGLPDTASNVCRTHATYQPSKMAQLSTGVS